jgi:glyoxylase-like metal-dependent hydrolase (beta-lactamase superfamily II)
MSIPFVREIEFDYGAPQQVSPLIRRVIAPNPGPFTYTGTGVYIIGRGEVAVIDPGPQIPAHFEALNQALEGERVSHVLVTHSHADHSPLAHALAERHGAKVHAGGPEIPTECEGRLEAGDDRHFAPDVIVVDGQIFEGPDWRIRAIATPGHTSNHFAYALENEHAVFSGDHIMGWSTTVISPPDGDMADYFASLRKILDQEFDAIWPTHGPPVRKTSEFVEAYIAHRLEREAQILRAMHAGDTTIPDMVQRIYVDVDRNLHPAACHSVYAHILHFLKQDKVAVADGGAPRVNSTYVLR